MKSFTIFNVTRLMFSLALVLSIIFYLFGQLSGSVDFLLYAETSYGIAAMVGFLTLIHFGTFVGSKYFRVIYPIFFLFAIGALWKIMHWPFADLLLNIWALILVIAYVAHYFHKNKKGLIDHLKLIFVLTYIIDPILVWTGLSFDMWNWFCGFLIIYSSFLFFYIQQRQKKLI